MEAYREMLERTSTEWAPWYVIPADRKWVRDAVVTEILAETLEGLELKYPPLDPTAAHPVDLIRQVAAEGGRGACSASLRRRYSSTSRSPRASRSSRMSSARCVMGGGGVAGGGSRHGRHLVAETTAHATMPQNATIPIVMRAHPQAPHPSCQPHMIASSSRVTIGRPASRIVGARPERACGKAESTPEY